MNKFKFTMVIVMACLSLVAINSNAANDPTSKDVTPAPLVESQTIVQAFDVDVIGTSGTQSFTGVEPGDFITISGIGTPHSIAYEDEGSQNIPAPGPDAFQIERFYLDAANTVLVSLIYVDGILIAMDVDFGCDC